MTTLTITARDFANLVKPVIPHADRSEQFPLLTAVHLQTMGSDLYALATDRFTIGIRRATAAVSDGTHIKGTIPLQAIRQILTTFKPTRNSNPELTFEFGEKDVTVRTEGLDSGIFGGSLARFTFRLRDGDYPPIIKLFDFSEVPAEALAHTVSLNPSFLARFAAAQEAGEPMTMHPARKGKPVTVTIGPDFIGMIVPVRFADNRLEGWDALAALAKELQDADKQAKAAA